jgi:hypothetical protein
LESLEGREPPLALLNPLSGIGAFALAMPEALERLAESAPAVADYEAHDIALADGQSAHDDPTLTDDPPAADAAPPADARPPADPPPAPARTVATWDSPFDDLLRASDDAPAEGGAIPLFTGSPVVRDAAATTFSDLTPASASFTSAATAPLSILAGSSDDAALAFAAGLRAPPTAGAPPAAAGAPAAAPSPAANLPATLPTTAGQISSSLPTPATTPASVATPFGPAPLVFEANEGQAAAGVQFTAHGPGFGVAVAASGVTLDLPDAAVGLHLAGADPTARAAGLGLLSSTSNYFLGSDPSQWHTDVPNYAQVQYQNVYSGIDAVYSGADQRQLEYTFVVHAGADPGAIRLAVQGANGLGLDAQGDLVVHTAGGDLTQSAPVLYQDGPGGRQVVTGSFVLQGDGRVGFAVGAYDPSRTLFIDPMLSYSTYLGGSNNNSGTAIAVDSSGNSYVVGLTNSSNFPTTLGAYQQFSGPPGEAFVTKYNSSGSVVWSTYLAGSSFAHASGVAVDSSANVYVVGVASPNFPTTTGAYQTAFTGSGSGWNSFLTKLSSGGNSLTYSTYFGFTNSGVNTAAYGVALNSSGNAFVTGSTPAAGNGYSFPTTTGACQTTYGGGATDAFVTEFNTTGSGLVFSTYVGGSGDDVAASISLDGYGDALIAGSTTGSLPTTTVAAQTSYGGGAHDGFVAQVASDGGSLGYLTYVGGSGDDAATAVAADDAGGAYVTGWTGSSDFPTTTGAYQTTLAGGTDAFVAKVSPPGDALFFSTLLGGGGNDQGNAIALAPASGDVFVAGSTSSTNFPTAMPFQSSNGGGGDAFVAQLNPEGDSLGYASYLGGSSADSAAGVAVDANEFAYVTGVTSSSAFPTTAGAAQTTNHGLSDAFMTRVAPVPGVYVTATDPFAAKSGLNTGTFTVTRTGDLTAALTVSYTTAGDAVAGVDYQSLSGSVTIAAGASTATVNVTPINANQTTDPQVVDLVLSSGSNYIIGGSSSAAVQIFQGTLPTPTLDLVDSSLTANEQDGTTQILVFLDYAPDPALGQSVTVQYATSDGTAVGGTNYTSTSGTLTFAPGGTEQYIAVPIIDDLTSTGNKTFNVTLSSPTNAVLGSTATTTVTVFNAEPPTVSVAATQPNASEVGPANGTYRLTRTGDLDDPTTVYYQMSGTATAGNDYSGLSGSVVMAAGVSSVDLTLTPTQDGRIDGNETAVLTLLPDIHYAVGGSGTATVSIADDLANSTPVVSITATTPHAYQSVLVSGQFTVTRTGPILAPLTVAYQVDGSAVAGTDYTALSGSVTIPAFSTTATITVNPRQNPANVNGYRSVVVTLVAGTGFAVAAQPFAVVSVNNTANDPPPAIDHISPQDADFAAAGAAGRILMTTQYRTGYELANNTTAAGGKAQTQDAKVTISAWLDAAAAGTTVYFEALDPTDPGRTGSSQDRPLRGAQLDN